MNWHFWTVVLEKTLESPLACKEIQPVKIKEINPEYSLERLTLKLMLQNFGHLMRRADSDSDAGKDWRQEEKGATGDEMFGWHHQLNGHESVQAPGDGEEQGSLVCCRVRHDQESEQQ